jgi:hypothetical protein
MSEKPEMSIGLGLLCLSFFVVLFPSRVVSGSLPKEIKRILASTEIRNLHYVWHVTRRDKEKRLNREQNLLSRRFEPISIRFEPNSGEQFLLMHHHMIQLVNAEPLMKSKPLEKRFPATSALRRSIPKFFSHEDLESSDAEAVRLYKSKEGYNAILNVVSSRFDNPDWLRKVTADTLGILIDQTVHGWFHARWADERSFLSSRNRNNGIDRDDLLHPYTAHVNDNFWRIHIWIDSVFRKWGNYHEDEYKRLTNNNEDKICGLRKRLPQVRTLSDLRRELEKDDEYKVSLPDSSFHGHNNFFLR